MTIFAGIVALATLALHVLFPDKSAAYRKAAADFLTSATKRQADREAKEKQDNEKP